MKILDSNLVKKEKKRPVKILNKEFVSKNRAEQLRKIEKHKNQCQAEVWPIGTILVPRLIKHREMIDASSCTLISYESPKEQKMSITDRYCQVLLHNSTTQIVTVPIYWLRPID